MSASPDLSAHPHLSAHPDLRTPTGQLIGWSDALHMVGDPDGLADLGPAQLKILRALGIIDVALNGEPVALPVLLDGVSLNHRLSAAEIAGHHLELDPDLSILAPAVEGGVRLSTGERLELIDHRHLEPARAERPRQAGRRLLLGPPGWLRRHQVGEQVAVGLIDATLLVGPSRREGGVEPLAQRLVDMAEPLWSGMRAKGVPECLPLPGLVMGAMADGETLFTREQPVVPMTEVLAAAGMPHALGFVGPPGSTEVSLPPHALGNPASHGITGGLNDEEIARLLHLGDVISRLGLVDDPGSVLGTATRALMSQALRDADTLWRLADTVAAERGARILVDQVLPGAPVALRGPLHVLRATHHLRNGAFTEALADTAAAVRAAPEFSVAVGTATLLRVVCGDAEGLAELGDRGVDDQRYDDEGLDEDGYFTDATMRAWALLGRVVMYLDMAGCDDLERHQEVALHMAGMTPAHLPPDMLSDDLLFHRAGLERYAREVGPELGEEDRAWVEAWLGVDRRWWRIAAVDQPNIRLHPAEGGPEVSTRCPQPNVGTPQPEAGDLMLARVLPVGEEWLVAPGALLLDHDPGLEGLPDPQDIIGVRAWVARDRSTITPL